MESKPNSNLRKIISKYFKIVKNNPDFVISIGGDGTILISERLYPSIPKLTIKTSQICRKCDYSPKIIKKVLEKIIRNEYNIKEEMKIEAVFKQKKLTALNEIQIHNQNPIVAIRFDLYADRIYKNVIGDGVVIATPFGSTGYFKSISGIKFKKGIGIAFNNSHNLAKKYVIFDENKKIKVKLNRERGFLIRDNDNKFIKINEGESFFVKKSKEKALFINLLNK